MVDEPKLFARARTYGLSIPYICNFKILKQIIENIEKNMGPEQADKAILFSAENHGVIEVSTSTGAYWCRMWLEDNNMLSVTVDMNGEMIESAEEDGVMLDIGACIGRYTIPMAMKSSRVYAFEPHPKNYETLKDNTRRLYNVVHIPLALSNQIGPAKMYVSDRCELEHTICQAKAEMDIKNMTNQITIATTTLDKFVHDNQINNITGIKIDVEGFELEVLEGGRNTFTTQNALVIIETHNGADLEKVYQTLASYGYQMSIQGNVVEKFLPDGQYLGVKSA